MARSRPRRQHRCGRAVHVGRSRHRFDQRGRPQLGRETPQGTTLRATSSFTRTDGSTGNTFEALFETDATDTQFRGERGVAAWVKGAALPDAKGFGAMADLAVAISNDFELAEIVTAAASAMNTPSLKNIRAHATPVFGAWAQSLELTRELVAVLLDKTDPANVTLVDRARYVESVSGGVWQVTSSEPGVVLEFATLAEITRQPSAAGLVWQIEQAFSPSSRAAPVQHRENAPYLVRSVDGRAVVDDYGIENPDGSWRLASGRPVTDAFGTVIGAPTRADILALPAADGAAWRIEALRHNPYANLPVDRMGVNVVDGNVVDYTVEIIDADGAFHVWARNLDRALELQAKLGRPGEFNLRNYEIDFAALDEVGSTDDSSYRVEIMTAGQLHFASSIFGIDFQPQIMSANVDPLTGLLVYSVGSFDEAEAPTTAADGSFESGIASALALFDIMFQNYVEASRAFAVRLALQGGLSEFARGLAYDAPTDRFHATTDRELAPMFEAIFEQAPAGTEAAYDYLVAWREILEVVYPDYHLDATTNFTTGTVMLDQHFVFQMLLPAFEKNTIDADLSAVLDALGVDESRLVAHDILATVVEGSDGDDLIYVSSGDQTCRGGYGADVDFIGKDFGNGVIEDVEYVFEKSGFSADQLRFTQARSTDIVATRDGLDLVLEVSDTQGRDRLRIKDQFDGELIDPLFGRDFSADTEMVTIVFADGVIWDQWQIAQAVNHPLETDDTVLGSQTKDFIEGGKGNDVLRGGRDGDIYLFRAGDGDDRISDDNDRATDDAVAKFDLLQFVGGFDEDNLRFLRAGESNNLEIRILDEAGQPTGDRVTIDNQFDWINVPFFGLLFADRIERVGFEGGSFLTESDIMAHVLRDMKTAGSDIIYGFNNADVMDGGAGDDVLVGRAQNDTYVFGRGYGRDVVFDQHNDLFGQSFDVVEFHDDLRWTDFEFERTADSPTITLRIKGSDEALTLKDSYQSEILLGFVNMVERLDFADGTSWDYAKLAQHVVELQFSSGDDLAYGFEIDDRMDGGAGDDRLEGGAGADTYVFARGYGNDTVLDLVSVRVGDKVLFRDIAFDAVDISRAGEDLVFTIRDTGERLVIEGQYARLGQVLHSLTGYRPHAVETFVFSDQSVSFRDLDPEDVDALGTAAGETIDGSNFAETLDGRGGDDTLIGGSDGDTYLFDAGYGNDIILDRQSRLAWLDPQHGLVKEGDDTIRFGDDLTPDNVAFAKDGDDLLISVVGRTDTLRVRFQFRSIEDEIEWFAFKDGTRLHISDVEERLAIVGGSRGDDRIEGVEDAANVLDGRQGDDTLIGGRLGDTYAFGAAYDLDQIIESATGIAGAIDRVVFSASVAKDTIVISRSGDDLVIDLGNGEDRLTITDGFGVRQVERFEFADGSFWMLDEVRDRLLAGTAGDDVLDGQGGSDALAGGGGDDTYKFGIGSSDISVSDTAGVDRIVFGAGIGAAGVRFSDEGGDLLVRLVGHDDTLIILGGASRTSSSRTGRVGHCRRPAWARAGASDPG